jgi:putative Holliday junction resolvase
MTSPQPAPLPRRVQHRLLALDPGARRTGVALSDELGLFAHTRPALAAAGSAETLDAIARVVREEAVTEVVVGVPLGLHGADTTQSREAREFAATLRARLSVPVSEWDERLSTVEAGRFVKGRDRRRRGDLDSAAAAVILQAVLESRKVRAP